MIKAFLFDYGGVMTRSGKFGEMDDRLGSVLGIRPENAHKFLSPVWEKYIRGKIKEAELWSYIEAQSGQHISVGKRDLWNIWETTQLLPQMTELVAELKRKGYPVGLLSNAIPNTVRERREHNGYAGFDFLVLSCEVGYAKPDPEIYALAMEKFGGTLASEVVFLDDQERCLVPARELGMQTILVKDPAQAISEVRSLL